MNFLPVIARELRLAARRASTYYARCAAALIVTLLTLGMLFASVGGVLSAAAAGRTLFMALSMLGYLYALVNGAWLTADCISSEKREGTLGLLFLTRLRAADVVAGKLAARTWGSLYGLLAAFPITGLTFFWGGVMPNEYFRILLVLLNTLFFSVALGLFISVLSTKEGKAVAMAQSVALLIGLILPACAWWAQSIWVRNGMSAPPVFLIATPAGSLAAAWATPAFNASYFGASLLLTHLAGWFLLIAAAVILNRRWRDPPLVHKGSIAARPPVRSSAWGPVGRRTKPDWSARELNPVIALGERYSKPGAFFWASLVVLVTLWLIALIMAPQQWLQLPNFAGSAIALHLLLDLAIAAQACHAFAADRKSGALELLITTPLGERGVLRGRLLALKRQAFRPAITIWLIDLILCAAGCWKLNLAEAFSWILLFAGAVLFLSADWYVLAWVGLWLGLREPSAGRALRRTLAYVLLLPWLLFLGFLAGAGLLSHGMAFQTAEFPLLASIWLGGLFIASKAGLLGRAICELQDNFRSLVAEERRFAFKSKPRPLARRSAHWEGKPIAANTSTSG